MSAEEIIALSKASLVAYNTLDVDGKTFVLVPLLDMAHTGCKHSYDSVYYLRMFEQSGETIGMCSQCGAIVEIAEEGVWVTLTPEKFEYALLQHILIPAYSEIEEVRSAARHLEHWVEMVDYVDRENPIRQAERREKAKRDQELWQKVVEAQRARKTAPGQE